MDPSWNLPHRICVAPENVFPKEGHFIEPNRHFAGAMSWIYFRYFFYGLYHGIHRHYSPAFRKICFGTFSMYLTSKSKFCRGEHVFSVVNKSQFKSPILPPFGKIDENWFYFCPSTKTGQNLKPNGKTTFRSPIKFTNRCPILGR